MYSKTFTNHPKQNTHFYSGDRIVRTRDEKTGTFKWETCPMNGHNDAAGSWVFAMDDGEKVYLSGYIHDNFPWRIPNRYRVDFAAMRSDPAINEEDFRDMVPDEDDENDEVINQICDLLDQVVMTNCSQEEYNNVVEKLAAMVRK
tara:strand:- start:1763 stop:2197 length:435 start_codon:yes stop_codon:yes gene_type:complete